MLSFSNRNLKSNRGYSLIELVLCLVITFVMFPSSMVVFQQILQERFRAEARMQAVNAAQMILEHTLQRRFSETETITPETHSFTETVTPYYNQGLARYRFQILVNYVDPSDLNADCSGENACPPSSDYLRVRVTVSCDLIDPIQLTGLVTRKP